MYEYARILYAVGVVGVPVTYITWRSVRERKLGLLMGVVTVGTAVFLFPALVLAAVWFLLLAVMAVCLGVLMIQFLLGARLLFGRHQGHTGTPGRDLPTITVLIPARNEANVICKCLDSVLQVDYPADRLEVIVIDDGSSDATPRLVAQYQVQHRNVRLVVRSIAAHPGKAAALNDVLFGIGSRYVTILDADNEISRDFLQTVLAHFGDPAVGGVQVRTAGRNWAENWLTRLLELEFLGWQYCLWEPMSRSGRFMSCFGTGCVFQSRLLQEIGGFVAPSEDLQASFRLLEMGYRIVFCTATYTTGELVTDLPSAFRQRYRWARGTAHSIPKNRRLFARGTPVTLQQKFDLCSYPGLLVMMIVPYLQLSTHAISIVMDVHLPYAAVILIAYMALIVVGYMMAGLRNRREGQGMGPRSLASLLGLAVSMCLYYGALLLPALTKAFVDEFVLQSAFRTVKAEHRGSALRRSTYFRLPGKRSSP